MCALLIDIQQGDEVIMPSYTFVSTANAFVLRGATIKFVDISLTTLCIDLDSILSHITPILKRLLLFIMQVLVVIFLLYLNFAKYTISF